jgi:hypothetical protein
MRYTLLVEYTVGDVLKKIASHNSCQEVKNKNKNG